MLLGLDAARTAQFDRECRTLATNYLEMEDPTKIREIGLELKLEAPVGDLTLRGIIDRLELDDDGELVVTDYKTGRAPSPNWERKSLSGLNFYAFLCESVFGRRPAAIRLMYLSSKETITATPSEQSTKFLTHPDQRGVERCRDRLRARRLPTTSGPVVQLLLVPAVVSRVRWRPGARPRRGTRIASAPP